MEELTKEDYKRARENGINGKALYNRYYNKFWDKERAITEPLHKKQKYKWLEVAQQNGISPGTFRQRINRYGWDEEKAAITPVITLDEIGEYNRIKSRKHPQWVYDRMEENGISKDVLSARLRKLNWTLEEAVSVPPGTQLVDYYRNRVKELESQLG